MSDLLAAATRVDGLELELRTDTQYATAYLNERPFATVRRRHAFDDSADPVWKAWDTRGAFLGARQTARAVVLMIEARARTLLEA